MSPAPARLHSPSPAAPIPTPRAPTYRTRIKICGLTREQDVDAAVAAGADAVGFVLYPPSPRAVTAERAAVLARRLPPFVTPVLLFVNPDRATLIASAQAVPGALLQFHGDEMPAQCAQWAQAAGCAFVRAARIPLGEAGAGFDLLQYAAQYPEAQAILLDAHVDGYGGGGKAFNWSLLPPSVDSHLVLSGGLTPANVTDGIATLRPRCKTLAVDVSSGVEAEDAEGHPLKGIKDAGKIHRFVSAVRYQHDPEFLAEFQYELKHFVGRPSPVYHAARMSREMGGAQIYLKREDLNHTGAHKINNVIGQAMLAKRMGKPRVIAETGAGQHGVATATICARYGLECVVYMGAEDVKRQSPNVYRMKLLGATVVPVESGSKTLKDALNEAMRDWVANVDNTFYIIGTVAGPHPYPMMVRDFQSVIGQECLEQMPGMLAAQQLRGRRQQRHGHFLPLPPAHRHPPDRRGGRGRRPGQRQAFGFAAARQRGRAARQPHLHPAGCQRPDHRNAQHQRGAGLPRRGARARLAAGNRSC